MPDVAWWCGRRIGATGCVVRMASDEEIDDAQDVGDVRFVLSLRLMHEPLSLRIVIRQSWLDEGRRKERRENDEGTTVDSERGERKSIS